MQPWRWWPVKWVVCCVCTDQARVSSSAVWCSSIGQRRRGANTPGVTPRACRAGAANLACRFWTRFLAHGRVLHRLTREALTCPLHFSAFTDTLSPPFGCTCPCLCWGLRPYLLFGKKSWLPTRDLIFRVLDGGFLPTLTWDLSTLKFIILVQTGGSMSRTIY